jgi:hypothetical protein
MSISLRRVLVLAPPALLGIVNLGHPVLTPPIYRSVGPHLPWWGTLHLINLGLFSLMGLAVYLLLNQVHNTAASLSRLAIAVFIPLYAAFDALAGIGTGLLARLGSELPATQVGVAESLIDRYWSSGTINGLAIAGSIAWTIALLAAAVAVTSPERRRLAAMVAVVVFLAGGWARTHLFGDSNGINIMPTWWLMTFVSAAAMLAVGRPGIVAAMLTLAGLLFGAAHVPPTGPLGAACLLAAAVLLEFGLPASRRARSADRGTARLEPSQ